MDDAETCIGGMYSTSRVHWLVSGTNSLVKRVLYALHNTAVSKICSVK